MKLKLPEGWILCEFCERTDCENHFSNPSTKENLNPYVYGCTNYQGYKKIIKDTKK